MIRIWYGTELFQWSVLCSSNGNYNKSEEVGACSDLVCAVRYALLRIWRGGVTKRANGMCCGWDRPVRPPAWPYPEYSRERWYGHPTVVTVSAISLPSLHSRFLNDIYIENPQRRPFWLKDCLQLAPDLLKFERDQL